MKAEVYIAINQLGRIGTVEKFPIPKDRVTQHFLRHVIDGIHIQMTCRYLVCDV